MLVGAGLAGDQRIGGLVSTDPRHKTDTASPSALGS
jgi:hypothetical protein